MVVAATSCLGQTGAAAAPAQQLPASASYVPTMTFEVASVRPNKDADLRDRITMGIQTEPQTTTFRATNWRIEDLIGWAYDVDLHQIMGTPGWPWPTLFTITAKGDSDADAKLAALTRDQQWAEKQHMLQVLLADRFKLKAHWKTKGGGTYNLVLAKGGPKLGAQGSMPLSEEEKKNYGDRPIPALNQQKCDEHGCAYIAHGCSMSGLVSMLTSQFGRSVIDMTGLTGNYDFVLKYKGVRDEDRAGRR